MLIKKKTLATKLIIYNLLFSSFLTLILTSVQIFLDYKTELAESKNQFILIQNGFVNGLSSALWFFDDKQVQNHLDGILKIADVAELDLQINDNSKKITRSEYSANGPEKLFPLVYVHEGVEKNLGKLQVTLTLDKVYHKLEKKFIIVLLSNGLKTFCVSYFIFFMFYKMITLPIEIISAEAKKLSEKQLSLLTNEERSKIKSTVVDDEVNELDKVRNAITSMHENFKYSYDSLKNNQARLIDISEFTSDVIFETDSNFNIEFVKKNENVSNSFLEQIVVGKNIFYLNVDKETQIVLNEQRKNLKDLAEIRSFLFEVDYNNNKKFYSMSIRRFSDLETKKFLGYRGVFVDVTARKDFEKQIEEQKNQIKQIQKVDAIGELTSGIAHDFNNVLSVVSGSLKMISRLELESDSLNKNLIKAQNATERGIKLSKRLLSFSRRQLSEEKLTNLNEGIESLMDILNVALTSSTTLNKSFQENLWLTKLDLNMFENVIINLSVNARDAMVNCPKTEVTIETKNVIHKDKEMVMFSIADTGQGIPPEIIGKIFEPFFTTKDIDKGTGLGLSMVFNFIKEYEGDIEIDSIVGKGTCFKLYLPRSIS